MVLFILTFFALNAYGQTPLPHGMVFGAKPDTTGIVEATKLDAFMGKKIRISTTIRGKVAVVAKENGGWFEIEAENGKRIAAHFKAYGVTLPAALKGRVVIIEGVAVRHVNPAVGQQANAGKAKSESTAKLGFEVSGLMVYK